jgi:hypothetical protein
VHHSAPLCGQSLATPPRRTSTTCTFFLSDLTEVFPAPQDKYHLYFLFDLMTGGDLMDVLVAEAKVIKRRIPQGTWKRGPFSPKVRHSQSDSTLTLRVQGTWKRGPFSPKVRFTPESHSQRPAGQAEAGPLLAPDLLVSTGFQKFTFDLLLFALMKRRIFLGFKQQYWRGAGQVTISLHCKTS